MTASFIADTTIIAKYELVDGQTFDQQFSNVSLENILFVTMAFAIWAFEMLMDTFRLELTDEMALQKPHTKDWYRNKMLGFLYGVPVIEGTDQFDTTGLTDEQIAAAQVVKQAATVKLISNNGYGILRVKVAGAASNGVLQPLTPLQYASCQTYLLNYVVDAGTQVRVTTGVADKLQTSIDIYYDNLVLDPEGQRLDGSGNTPVQNAITAFLQNIAFNGVLNIKELETAITIVDGVKYANVTNAASKYGDYEYTQTGIPNVGAINVFRVADSGYFVMEDLNIKWKLYEQ